MKIYIEDLMAIRCQNIKVNDILIYIHMMNQYIMKTCHFFNVEYEVDNKNIFISPLYSFLWILINNMMYMENIYFDGLWIFLGCLEEHLKYYLFLDDMYKNVFLVKW